jgi:uncharacterized repeat protein (TIGR01451 family)
LTLYTVTSAADSGPNTLRAAIVAANGDSSTSDTIQFSIGTGQQTISLLSPLPAITRSLTLDGTKQGGFSGTPLIVLDGSSAGSGAIGLDFTAAGGNTVEGLDIVGFGSTTSGVGIALSDAGNDVIAGDYIGVKADGSSAEGNGNGIVISAPNVTIGGTSAAARDVISGNVGSNSSPGIGVQVLAAGTGTVISYDYIGTNATGTAAAVDGVGNAQVYGIYLGTVSGANVVPSVGTTIGGTAAQTGNLISGNFIGITGDATGALVAGNLIGTDSQGQSAVSNSIGVFLGGSAITVGGTSAAARNVISGNNGGAPAYGDGIDLSGQDQLVEGNYIGTNGLGTSAIPNASVGLALDATASTVGGTVTGAGNVISGNTGAGLTLGTNGSDLIEGNLIGTEAGPIGPLGNGGAGVSVTIPAGSPSPTSPLALNDTIGGTVAGAVNTIANNGGAGVSFVNNYGAAVTGLTIRGNSISNNAKLGIDLNGSGTPIPGTLFLTQTGANTANQPTISGVIYGTPLASYAIDLYGNVKGDASGFGQGQSFLGTAQVTTNGAGFAAFTQVVTLPASNLMLAPTSITATATGSDGTTSEFALNLPTPANTPTANLSIATTTTNATVIAGATLTITETITNAGPNAASAVELTDTLSNNLVNTTAAASTGTVTITNGLLQGNFGTLASGQSITVTVTGTAAVAGTIVDSPGVISTTLDPDYSNNQATQTITVASTSTPTADLSITQVASPTTGSLNGNQFFTLTIQNFGPSDAPNVTVTDFLPSGATLVNVAPSQGGFASLTGTVLTDNLGTVASGQVATILIVVKPTATGTLVNAANVSSGVLDPITSNNSTSTSVPVTTADSSAISLAQASTPPVAAPGGLVVFTLSITNNGTGPATGVTVVDAIPAGSTLVNVAPSQGGFASFANGVVTDSALGSIAAGATATIQVIVQVGTASPAVNFVAAIDENAVNPAFVYSQAVVGVANGPRVVGVAGVANNAQILVTFNEPLNIASAQNPANYRLYNLGNSPSGKPKPIPIKAAYYNQSAANVTLIPSQPLSNTQYFELVVIGTPPSGITDTAGRPLDGDLNQNPGTNYSVTFYGGGLPQV